MDDIPWNSRGYWGATVRIRESPWYGIQVDESTDDDKATMLVFVRYIFRRMCTRVCHVHFCCQPTPELKSLNDYISGKLNWSFCVSICMDGAAAITRQLSGFTTREKRLLLIVNLHTVSSIEKCRLAEKCHLNLTMFDRLWLKLSTPLKHATLTHVWLRSSVRRWTQSSHAFSYTQKWGGFLKEDHWPECFCYKGHSRDFF